ncbi:MULTISPECIES: response regulator transcription factor [Phycicoccus]|jgi:DNA-binding response OmpR family regulator|uniref:response regulator transcription factor n=1 Tax=Phycicoccus TaxID=367298 RepID=UPI001DE62066|nr:MULTISPECIES: response regulator transcription factor [Phycicoccus]MCB1238841.1 response regulator transcription factor [Tetrasphaera sp.]HPF76420.1 response regulator transcription factor [Phycicoccus elongatus]HRC17209.1 response regulator transcription factor [Phycicoccus elongatus]HRV56893.1 response regulator transcription factor [Phycicoccus sp.]
MTATPARLLVVEDDEVINESLTLRLEAQGYAVTRAFDGPGAVEAFTADPPDVVLLDIMLPGFDGLEVCRRIQAIRPVPVLMLTARDEETDILIGLAVGADDYVTKPFRMREVVARVQALLRRVERAAELAARPTATDLVVGGLTVSPSARRVTVQGSEIHLTPLEFDLLRVLAEAPGRVFERDQLLRDVWGWADAYGTRTLDSHVKALRAKIGADRIRTVHGVGYAAEARP